jgi:hypothetical protein
METNHSNAEVTNPTSETIHKFLNKNGLEAEIEKFAKESVDKIKFSIIYKPAIISLVALIISFFIDVSNVPILGNVSIKLSEYFFPEWQPAAHEVTPFTFWWLPLIIYALYIFLSWLAFEKLKAEVVRTPASETIDRIISSYTSVTDSISTALPLIGAAILLLSIRLGEDIFLGLSVPFEIKALIVLALGKLFEPILDQMGIEFQNVVNHVKDIKERYFSKIQIETSKDLLSQFKTNGSKSLNVTDEEIEKISNYNKQLAIATEVSTKLIQNYSTLFDIMSKVKPFESVTLEKISQINALANSITQAATSLGDEKTLAGLKHLENIVIKK